MRQQRYAQIIINLILIIVRVLSLTAFGSEGIHWQGKYKYTPGWCFVPAQLQQSVYQWFSNFTVYTGHLGSA